MERKTGATGEGADFARVWLAPRSLRACLRSPEKRETERAGVFCSANDLDFELTET